LPATVATIIGGLVIFLYSVSQLSRVMGHVFTDKAKEFIRKFTYNAVLSILTGIVVTIILQSSSAVIILTIVFVNSQVLNFKQAIGIVMGANIGTTFSSQLISLDIGKYSVFAMALGMLIMFFGKKSNTRMTGQVFLFLGLLFFGLFTMENGVEPFKDSENFESWMLNLDNPFMGAAVGGITTLIIQSSSATVGIAITLGKQNLIHIAGGIAVMLGAELGTCSDTLLATIGGRREAIKTGLFHLLFNLTTIFIGLMLFDPFVKLVKYISSGSSINAHIANAHMMFNILGVLCFLPFVPLVYRIMNRFLPDKQ